MSLSKMSPDPVQAASPWDKGTLPSCPADTSRTTMEDYKTHVVKWPNVGASCALQIEEEDVTLVMLGAGYTYEDIREQELKCKADRNREWKYDAATNTWACPLQSYN